MPPRKARQLPIKLYPSKFSLIALFLTCVAFVAAGIWMVLSGEWKGYFVLALFFLGTVVSVVQLLPDSTFLLIEETGFTTCSLFRKHKTSWNDVSEFVEITIGPNRAVGIIYMPQASISLKARQIAYAMSGVEGALPDSYGMKVSHLTALMNELLREYRSSIR